MQTAANDDQFTFVIIVQREIRANLIGCRAGILSPRRTEVATAMARGDILSGTVGLLLPA